MDGKGTEINALNASQGILQGFWDLASLEDGKRQHAAQMLVKELLAEQNKHEEENKDGAAAPTEDVEGMPKPKQLEHALSRCSPVMVYGLRRLTRGLSSGRQGARQGFASALAMLLAKINIKGSAGCVTASNVILLLDCCLEASNSMKGGGGEARDVLLGRVFGMGSLVRSGLIPTNDSAVACAVVKELLSLSNKKSFLREAAIAVMLEMCQQLDAVTMKSLLEESEPLRSFLTVSSQEASAEALLLSLVLWPQIPADLIKLTPLPQNCPPPPATFLSPRHQPAAANSNKKTPKKDKKDPTDSLAATSAALFSSEYLKSALNPLLTSTSSNPRLHTMWNYLLPFLLPSYRLTKGAPNGEEASAAVQGVPVFAQVEVFWNTVVEGGLLNSTAHERRFLALQLFQVILPHLEAEHVPIVFGKHFSKMLVNNLRNSKTYLHPAAKRCMEKMSTFQEASGDGSLKLAVAAALQRLGGMGIEAQVAGKSTSKLVTGMDAEGVHGYCEQMMSNFLMGSHSGQEVQMPDANDGDGEAEEASNFAMAADQSRAYSIEQLVTTARFPAASDEDRIKVLRFLAAHAFFEPSADAAPATPAATTPSKKKSKKGSSAAGVAVAELEVLSEHKIQISPMTRRLCAQRLLLLAGSIANANVTQNQLAHQAGGQAGKKKSKAEDDGEKPSDPSSQANPSLTMDGLSAFLHSVLGAVDKGSARLAKPLGDSAAVSLAMLREVEDSLVKLAASQPAAGAEEKIHLKAISFLHLVRILQIMCLGDPENFTEESAADLRMVVKEGLKAELPDLEVEGAEDEGAEDELKGGNPLWADVMLDLFLSLLARPAEPLPTLPLREAVEGTWRHMCKSLTTIGMQDLIRVVTASKGDDEDEVLGDDEEEMEVDEAGEDGSDEEEEESDEEGEEVEEEERTGAAAGKKNDSDDSDEGEEDDDGADDDAMFRMDDKMAAYLRTMVDARKGAREQKLALNNLKLRALMLMEIFARKHSNSPLLLEALVPLTRALVTNANMSNNSGDLCNRLRAVLGKLYVKAPAKLDLSSGTGLAAEGALVEALKKALYVSSREKRKDIAELGGQVWASLMRSAVNTEEEASATGNSAASGTFSEALQDHFKKKKSRLTRKIIEGAARRAPSAAQPSLGELLQECVSARNTHVQVGALQLLATFSGIPNLMLPVTVKMHALGVSAALNAAIMGCGMKKAGHQDAAKAAVQVLEGLKRSQKDKRLAEVLGAGGISSLAKAVATTKSVGVPPSIDGILNRLINTAGIKELVGSTAPDAALKTKITKAKAKMEAAEAAKKEEAALKGSNGKKEGGGSKKRSGKGVKEGGKAKPAPKEGGKRKAEGKTKEKKSPKKVKK
eukprot:gene19314-25966_t